MSVTEMDAVQQQVLTFKRSEPITRINATYMVGVFKILQSLRQDEVLCDIKLKTDDSTIVFAHKVVLVSACPYFRAMFTSFEEINKDLVHIKELDSTVLQLLINYIYTGEIIITEENVKVLLAAANLLQLDYIRNVCVEFLQSHMDPSNCLSINVFANLHDCMELLSSSEAYIKKNFLEVVKYSEFLSLSSVEVIQLISRTDIFVPLEEKIYECVLNWVKHELDCRKDFFPELMEHVRLSLTSKQYLLENVVNEPLLKKSLKCINYVNEALHFHLLKSVYPFTNPHTIWSKPRQYGDLRKVILVSVWSESTKKCSLNWYDPETNICQRVLDMMVGCWPCHLELISNQFVFAIGNCIFISQSVKMLDLSSQTPSWISMDDMLVSREDFGVGVLNNCVYAVGGRVGSSDSCSAEVFDISVQEWRKVLSMTHKRSKHGVGVLNNLLYAVGGYDSITKRRLKSVECYDPSLDKWTLVAEMAIGRSSVGIGVLDGVMYAIGGYDGSSFCNNVEAYSSTDGVWTTIANMHLCRYNPTVVTLDGLLYVFGGWSAVSTYLDSIEIYNPNTNTWKLMKHGISNGDKINGGIVAIVPPHFLTD